MKTTCSVAVIGGGVVGIHSALELAKAGFYVHLVEKKSGLGGLMAQMEHIFPTNDCSPCLLSTRLLECSRHHNIAVHSQSRVLDIQGPEGNMLVQLRKFPDFIDPDKCIACNKCSEICIRFAPDEFNLGLDFRKAAYILHHQSIPSKYVIDEKNCLRLTRGVCGACEKICPTGAIDFNDQEKSLSLNVHSVILAPGLDQSSPAEEDIYGYTILPDVVTSLEFERLLSHSGPNKGILKRPSDSIEPKRVAWLQCVGSRTARMNRIRTCSSFCCMYSMKQAMNSRNHVSRRMMDCTIFFNDIRAHGKGHEQFYEKAKDQKVRFIRSIPHTILPGEDGKGVYVSYATSDSRLTSEYFDLLVLSVGFFPGRESTELAEMLGVRTDRFGLASTSSFNPFESSRKGIYIAGGMLSPRGIRQSITDAVGAAGVAARVTGQMRKKDIYQEWPAQERDVSAQSPRIGIFICSCGGNISEVIDVDALVRFSYLFPEVVLADTNLFTCPKIIQDDIARQIIQYGLNRVVIAACTPITHETLYQNTLEEAGLNPHLLEIANIRNQNSWVHKSSPEEATDKAKLQIAAAETRCRMNKPLKPIRKKVIRKALVIGAGLTGLTTALELAEQGFATFLVEKTGHLGGNAWKLRSTWKGEDVAAHLKKIIPKVESNPRITLMKRAEVVSSWGSVGNFISQVRVERHDGVQLLETIRYGAAVLCTGATECRPDEYMYGRHDRVFTHLEFDRELQNGAERFKQARTIVFIQCAGSRERKKPYCSRVCCAHSMETALFLKSLNKNMNIYVLYVDIRTYGAKEILYQEALRQNVIFIRYDKDNKPRVCGNNKHLTVKVDDHILKCTLEIQTDYLVLASGIIPNPDMKNLAGTFKFSLDSNGFTMEEHYLLKPTDLSARGVFAAGLCNSPKPVEESVSQAQAAVSRARQILLQDQLHLNPIKATVTRNCDGCGLCIDICPYEAIIQDGSYGEPVQIDRGLCEGCGLCVSSCPKNGVTDEGHKLEKIRAQISSILNISRSETRKIRPIVLAFCCSSKSYLSADHAGSLRRQYSPNAIIIRISCTGILSHDIILDAFKKGVDGIMVMGCRKGECRHRHGDRLAAKKMPLVKAMMKEQGINRERLMSAWFLPTDGIRFAEMVNVFTRQIKQMNFSQTTLYS